MPAGQPMRKAAEQEVGIGDGRPCAALSVAGGPRIGARALGAYPHRAARGPARRSTRRRRRPSAGRRSGAAGASPPPRAPSRDRRRAVDDQRRRRSRSRPCPRRSRRRRRRAARSSPHRLRPRQGRRRAPRAGCAAASASVATPPEERITSGSGQTRPRRRRPEAPRGSPTSAGPRYASTAAVEARSYSRNSGATSCEATTRARGSRRRSSSATARSWLGSRNEKSRQTATASIRSSQRRQRVELQWREHTVRPDPLAHSVAALERHERLGVRLAEPVEMSAVLAAKVQQVLEPRGRDEGGPRAFPLEQSVRGRCGAVREALDDLRADGARPRRDRFLLPRPGRHLGRPQAAVVRVAPRR